VISSSKEKVDQEFYALSDRIWFLERERKRGETMIEV
jgi:hypothetical protein